MHEQITPQLQNPLKLTISINRACNQRCAICYSRCNEETAREELNAMQWKTFIDYLAQTGFIQIFIEGGEPLLKPGILDLVQHASTNLWVWLRTNATLVDDDLAKRLAEARIGTVCVDLFSADAEVHDTVAGIPGSYAAAMRGMNSLVTAGITLYTLVTLTRQSAPTLQRLAELSARVGARAMGVLRLYPLGRAKERWRDFALSMEEMNAAIHGLTSPPGLRIMHSWHPNDGNCCYQNAAVNPYGDSIGCPYLREYVNYGNVKDVPFLETWRHPLYERLRKGNVSTSCPKCERSQRSRGGCRSTAFAFTGDWDAGDPFCTEMNKGVDLRELPAWLLQATPEPPKSAKSRNGMIGLYIHQIHRASLG